ncbi:MAG: HIT family protein [Bacteroidetes bacterium]|nr:HIT family protein [Bacteroidota bacterium]
MATIFSKIILGEIPCYKIAEDDEFLAFLDINPLAIGHTLVIPKLEVDYIFDLEDEFLGRMMSFSKEVARKLKNNIDCKRIGVCVIGLEVPHAHIHLIPINTVSDMNFSKTKLVLTDSELKELQSTITGC